MYQLVPAISFVHSLFTRSFTDRLHLVFQVQCIVYWIHSLIFQYFSSSSLLLVVCIHVYIANKNVIIVYKSAVFFKWNKNLNRNGRNYWIQNICIIKKSVEFSLRTRYALNLYCFINGIYFLVWRYREYCIYAHTLHACWLNLKWRIMQVMAILCGCLYAFIKIFHEIKWHEKELKQW